MHFGARENRGCYGNLDYDNVPTDWYALFPFAGYGEPVARSYG